MRNLLLTLRYHGTDYCGFQVQKNGITIMEKIQDAIEAVTGDRSDIKGCSRTDAGVHAQMYCLSVKTESVVPLEKMPLALNARLPDDIAVYGCQEAPPDFHARYDCTGKEYMYLIHHAQVRDPFWKDRAYEHAAPLDIEAMKLAGDFFVGTHDFKSFCGGKDEENTTRTIFHFRLEKDGDMIRIFFGGSGFLFHMVRIMVGTLLWVGAGRLKPEQMPEIMAAKNRMRAGMTAPPQGLYLHRVFYDEQRGETGGEHPQHSGS